MLNPLVIGYKGEIGSFILQGLLKVMPKASNIWCVDIGDSKEEILKRIRKSDVIFLCVPLQFTVQWFLDWGSELKGKIVIEQTSLKSILFNNPKFKKLNKIYNINILSMHILFRPSVTPDLNDRRILLINESAWSSGEGWEPAEKVIDISMIERITTSIGYFCDSIDSHDSDMAIKQALVHRVILSLDNLLRDGNINTYIGCRVNDLASRIARGDKELYKIIQTNPNLEKVIQKFKKSLDKFTI